MVFTRLGDMILAGILPSYFLIGQHHIVAVGFKTVLIRFVSGFKRKFGKKREMVRAKAWKSAQLRQGEMLAVK